MKINISLPKHLSNTPTPLTTKHLRLFSDITNNRHFSNQKQQKLILTKDTLKNQQSQLIDMKQIDFHIQNKLKLFKQLKAEEIADISIDGEIPVRNIIKRMKNRMEKELFEYLHKAIKDMHMYEEKSAEKTVHSPKELGSTIEHTYTPKSIETPAFDFDSQGHEKINEFTVGSNEFTLNPKSTQNEQKKGKVLNGQVVSQFTLGPRNPTSKKIKDKIMNSRKNHNY